MHWSPEQWVVVITGALSALGTLIVTVIHAWASARGREENREQNTRIESGVAEVQGTLSGTGDGTPQPHHRCKGEK